MSLCSKVGIITSKSVLVSSRKQSGMPNRYEREIEEILRNLEQTEPKQGLGQKFGERLRRKPVTPLRPRQRVSFNVHFTPSEWLLIIVVVGALLAGGYAYASQGATIFTGIVAACAMVCFILVMFSQFIFRARQAPSSRYGNVRPIRRGPLTMLKTRWNLFMLKMRYRRKSDQ